MKSCNYIKLNHGKIFQIAIVTALFLLAGCAGRNADLDMIRSMSNGNIDRQEQISAVELYKILTDHFGKVLIKLSDSKYTLPDNGKVVQLKKIVVLKC